MTQPTDAKSKTFSHECQSCNKLFVHLSAHVDRSISAHECVCGAMSPFSGALIMQNQLASRPRIEVTHQHSETT